MVDIEKVKHEIFGEGLIKSFNKEHQSYTVIFDNDKERTIMAKFLLPVDNTHIDD